MPTGRGDPNSPVSGGVLGTEVGGGHLVASCEWRAEHPLAAGLRSAPHSLDIEGTWRWAENKFWGPFDHGSVICGVMDGHLTNNLTVLKGEEVVLDGVTPNNPHFYIWGLQKRMFENVENETCHFENPQAFGYHPQSSFL